MRAVTYLHGSEESLHDEGKKLGLTGDALENFSRALYEVKVELEVSMNSGEARIVKVDEREVSQ